MKFWYDIRDGEAKWELSGFFAWTTYVICIEAIGWSPGLSVVTAGMIGHIGADKVKSKLLDFFNNRIR